MSALMSTRASLRLPRRDVATAGRNLSSGGAARRPILCQRFLRYHRTRRSGFRDKLKAEAATPTTESLKTGEEGDDGTDEKVRETYQARSPVAMGTLLWRTSLGACLWHKCCAERRTVRLDSLSITFELEIVSLHDPACYLMPLQGTSKT